MQRTQAAQTKYFHSLNTKVSEPQDNFWDQQFKNLKKACQGAKGVPWFYLVGKYLLFCEYKTPIKFQNSSQPPSNIFNNNKHVKKPKKRPGNPFILVNLLQNPTTTPSGILVTPWRRIEQKINTKNSGLPKLLRW